MLDWCAAASPAGVVLWAAVGADAGVSALPAPVAQAVREAVARVLVDATAVPGEAIVLGGTAVHWLLDGGILLLAGHARVVPLGARPAALLRDLALVVRRTGPYDPAQPFDLPAAQALSRLYADACLRALRQSDAAQPGCAFSSAAANGPQKRRDWGGTVSKARQKDLDLSAQAALPDAKEGGANASLQADACGSELEDVLRPVEAASGARSAFWGAMAAASLQSSAARLSADEVDAVLASARESLVARNVASSVADALASRARSALVDAVPPPAPADSVAARLFGASRRAIVAHAVRLALEDAAGRVLSPGGAAIDVLAEAQARPAGRPYVIAFVGVNGVGKTTTVAKTAFLLASRGLRVLLAACDTFRAGAVEQLRFHADALSAGHDGRVSFFSRGYGGDAAAVAAAAVAHARRSAVDVVLLDTAGRMEDAAPLMAALGRLVASASPDRILFVGEALVGNAAVAQIGRFNAALQEGAQRRIDGLVVSKFDAVGECVGAVLTMAHVAAAPVVWLGVGQTYTDLRRPAPAVLVRALLDA